MQSNKYAKYKYAILLHMTAKKAASLNFEKSLQELEEIVSDMEQGDLSLEQSLKSFERGVKLTKVCQKTLSDAEQKVEILLKETSKEI